MRRPPTSCRGGEDTTRLIGVGRVPTAVEGFDAVFDAEDLLDAYR